MKSAGLNVIVFKSDRFNQKPPSIGQTVRVRGRSGLHKVMRIDTLRRVADVKTWAGTDVEHTVPFADIRGLNGQTVQAIKEFLHP